MPHAGDTVKIITKKETVEGIFMPSSDPNIILLKLKTGYNIGFQKKDVTKITMVEKKKETKSIISAITKNKNLPAISILHTGGTIASKVDYRTGGVYAGFTAEDFLGMFPEMKEVANIRSIHVSNMMSEDMRFKHYQLIAKAIEKEISEGADGIIVGHGTDTLAITAAALAFMFENLPIPVMLVGSQRSSDRGSTDAAINLLCATKFMTKTNFKGIAICMHEQSSDTSCLVMPATKTRKMHTSRRDAFKVVNGLPLARVDATNGNIQWLQEYFPAEGKMSLRPKLEEKVAIIKTHINMSPIFFDALIKEKFKGLILEGTGIGQAPMNIEENFPNYKALQKFIKSGGIVVLTSQCIWGAVHSDIYSNCRRLKEIGVIFGKDMLTETAHVKLSWLLANYPRKEVEKLITQNLRGEINERLEYTNGTKSSDIF